MGDSRLAPDIVLKSVVSGRTINPRKTAVPLVLVFATQATTELVNPLRQGLRERFPDPAGVVIASVVDLARVPRLMRKMAESALSKRYEEVVATLKPGHDPSQFVVMLPDWKGEVADAVGLSGLEAELGVVVIAPGGAIAGTCRGTDPLEPAAGYLASMAAP